MGSKQAAEYSRRIKDWLAGKGPGPSGVSIADDGPKSEAELSREELETARDEQFRRQEETWLRQEAEQKAAWDAAVAKDPDLARNMFNQFQPRRQKELRAEMIRLLTLGYTVDQVAETMNIKKSSIEGSVRVNGLYRDFPRLKRKRVVVLLPDQAPLTTAAGPGRPIDMGGPRGVWIEDLPWEKTND